MGSSSVEIHETVGLSVYNCSGDSRSLAFDICFILVSLVRAPVHNAYTLETDSFMGLKAVTPYEILKNRPTRTHDWLCNFQNLLSSLR